jgi:hypothetical protein
MVVLAVLDWALKGGDMVFLLLGAMAIQGSVVRFDGIARV